MTSLVLRANLSDEEWRELRKLAIDLNVSVPSLVGTAVRDLLVKHRKKVRK